MSTNLLVFLAYVFAAGAVGGVVNALMSDNGFVWPKSVDENGIKILRPGFLGNIFIGGVAASLSWGLYGPFATAYVVKAQPQQQIAELGQPQTKADFPLGLTLAALAGALLVGVGGSRWLTNEVDKKLLRAAASEAAAGHADAEVARSMSNVSAVRALELVRQRKTEPDQL